MARRGRERTEKTGGLPGFYVIKYNNPTSLNYTIN